MTQYVINIGAIPNDGTGDPLRTAFNETNLNFDQVFTAGPVLSNIQIANNKILTTNTNGNLVLAPNGTGVVQSNVSIVPNLANLRNLGSATNRWSTVYTQYLNATQINLTGDLTVAGNLTVSGNIIQIGNIVTDSLTIQLANTASNASSANGAGITVGVNDNIATILYNSTGNIWTTNIGISSVGNISAPYFVGNGSQLTGLAATYGNANVVTLLAGFGSNNISTTGSIGSNNISTTGNITSNGLVSVNSLRVNQTANSWGIVGNTISAPSGAFWTSNPALRDEFITSALDGYINLISQYANGNIASQVHLEHGLAQIVVDNGSEYIWEFDDTGNMTLPGNSFAVNYANGNPVILGGNYGNSNVTTLLANFGNNTISTSGNITGGIIFGNIVAADGNTSVQINRAGLLGAAAGFSYDYAANILYAPTGSFQGFPGQGTDAILVGVPGTPLGSNITLQITSNVNSYSQINQQNISTGNNASADYIITSDNGTDSTYYLDVGLAGSNHADPDFFGDTTTANDGYLYVTGSDETGPGSSGVGNLILGSTNGNIKMFVGNTAQANVIATVDSSGLTINTGNLTLPGNSFAVNYANGNPVILGGTYGNSNVVAYGESGWAGNIIPSTSNVYTLGNSTNQWSDLYVSNATIYMNNVPVSLSAGNVLTVNGNAVLTNGSNTAVSTTGNITADYFFGNGSQLTGISANTGNVTFSGETVIGTGTSNTVSGLYLAPDPVSLANDLYLRVRGNIQDEPTHIHFDTGNNQYYNQFIGDDYKYVQLANTGNIVINTSDYAGNSAQWTFGTNESLTLPGGSRLRPLGANLDIFAGTGSYVNLITDDESSSMGVGGAGGYVVTAGGTWNFNTNGNLTAPGNISAVGNIIGGNIVTSGNITTSGSGGDITMSSGNITGVGNISAGNLIATGNIVLTGSLIGSGASPAPSLSGFSSVSAITISASGNITAANFFGNGNTLSNVATTFESTWTVPVGNSTQSFTVSPNNTYYLWVDCNIPNGILTWNATATVTNTNVPVVGAQYAWVYSGGGTPIDFTSIPNQFVGTANTIVRSSVAPSATTNRFDFGINNTSGNSQTVRYGWAQIS